MTMLPLSRKPSNRPVTAATRKPRHPGRLSFETLEDRCCPATYTVLNTLDDSSVGSLRWAIGEANANAGDDTIEFDGTTFATPQTITLSGTQLELTDTTGITTIIAPDVTVSGGGLSRVFQVDEGAVAFLSGLTITGGSVTGNGAGLLNLGNTTLTDCSITGNHAIGGFVYDSSTPPAIIAVNGHGGGVLNSGALVLTNSTISGNTADLLGGGVLNSLAPGSVATAVTLDMTSCTVTGNSAGVGSGIANRGATSSGSGKGSTTIQHTLKMTDCTVSGNQALPGGGTSGPANAGAGFGVLNLGIAALTSCTVTGNDGGGVYNGGTTSTGGGKGSTTIPAATLNMSNTAVSGNLAPPGAGTVLSGAAGFGLINQGTATLTNCTVSGNDGGGVQNTGVSSGSGKGSSTTAAALNMTNCTVSGNQGPAGGVTGVNNQGSAAITHSTISGNDVGVVSAAASGGGKGSTSSTTALSHAIVAGNTFADLSGTGYSGSNNLIGTGGSGELVDAVNGNIVGVPTADLHLAPLADNGGPTLTMALLPGSPAINNGVPVVFTALAAPILDGSVTSISVASTTGLGIGLYIQIDSEIMRIASVDSATSLTVERGQLDTTAMAHNITPTNVTLIADQRGVAYLGAPDIGAFEFISVVTISQTGGPAAEGGATNLTYTLTRDGDTTMDLPVQFTIAGTAGLTADYTASSPDAGFTFDGVNGTVTIAAGSSTATVVITPVNDTLVEGDETVDLTVAVATGYSIGTPSSASGTIADNDTATISIATAPTVTESGGGQTIVVTLTTSDGAGGTATLAPGVTLTADVVDLGTGSASSPADYDPFGTQTVTFVAGDGDGTTQTVTLTPVNDTLVEGNETVDLQLQNLSTTLNGQASLGNTASTVTIEDNDTTTLSIVPTRDVTEQGGPQTILVTLTTSDGAGGTATLAPGITLTADVVDLGTGSALSPDDYAPFGTQPVSFGPGSGDGAVQNVTIAPVNDLLFDLNETVNLQLQGLNTTLNGQAGLGNVDSTVTILSDDPMPNVALGVKGTPFDETGGVATVTATLDALAGVDVTVTLAFSGTATPDVDYTSSASQIVILAGQLTGSITLTGLTDDLDEPAETVIVDIAGLINGIESGQQQVAATITDNNASIYAVAGGAGVAGDTRVNVYNGDGTLRFTLVPYAGWTGEVHVTTGDVNGDGIHDIVTGAGPGSGPHVKVFDGASGAEIRSFFAYAAGFTGGVFVGAGDVNNDGFADIITGAGAEAGSGPHVKVFDGQTGAVLRSFMAYGVSFSGGVTVAGGDIDHDGFADIITGSASGASHVKVFSGQTGAELRSFFAYPGFDGGIFVAAGDTDGDGYDDIVTGSASTASHVKVFSGRTGAELQSFFAFGPGFTGGVRLAAKDENGDGIADIIAGAGPEGGPHVIVFDGLTLAEVQSFLAFDPAFTAGIYVG